MLQTRWSGEAWSVVRVEFRRAVALRGEIRRAGWSNGPVARPRPEEEEERLDRRHQEPPDKLRVGDRLVDESGERQVLARPYTTGGGKTINVCVQRADRPDVMAIRVLGCT